MPLPVIAIDGPSGSGKSTVARAVAERLGWRYVDTGATYRAITLAVLDAGVDPGHADAVTAVARELVQHGRLALSTDPRTRLVQLDGTDVSDLVRSPPVTAAVSAVSAVPAVRALLVELQRELAGDRGAVLEGRDIASVVFPDAPVKIYLDASAAARASRRAADTHSGVASRQLEAVETDLARRDALDSTRAASPLLAADGAVHLDSTAMDVDEVVTAVLQLAREAAVVPRSGAGR